MNIEDPTYEKSAWEFEVLEKNNNRCCNCGGVYKVAVRMVVPVEIGGFLTDSNGILLCRACELAIDAHSYSQTRSEQRKPINFWVSSSLYNCIQTSLQSKNSFDSMGSMVRYLISKYSEDPDRFDDLNQYQNKGADLKVNVWVDADKYLIFKHIVEKNGATVTDVLTGLISLYETEGRLSHLKNT